MTSKKLDSIKCAAWHQIIIYTVSASKILQARHHDWPLFFFLPHKCIHKEYTLLMLYDLYSLNAVNLCHFYCATADIMLWCTNWSLWAFLVFNKFSGWGKSRQTFVMLNKFSHLGCMLQSFTCCQIKAKIISVSTLDPFPFINVGFFLPPTGEVACIRAVLKWAVMVWEYMKWQEMFQVHKV